MANIQNVIFYFANPTLDESGNILYNEPPEMIVQTWAEVQNNTGFSVSTGESIYTELPDPANPMVIRLINGFYFGTGKFGSLLAIQYSYDDGTKAWVKAINYKSSNSEHLDVIIGNWMYGLSYLKLTGDSHYTGKPFIGLENDYVEVQMEVMATTDPSEPDPEPVEELNLTPDIMTIKLGATATFEAQHPYEAVGDWSYSEKLEVVSFNNRSITVRPLALGAFEITYTVETHVDTSKLYVQEDTGAYEDPVEPAPPTLPNTPPSSNGEAQPATQLMDASVPPNALYKYPNIMKRNSRYRGHRESEKVLNDHQEQLYDIRQLYKDLDSLGTLQDTTIKSWFYGDENSSISIKSIENLQDMTENSATLDSIKLDSVRAFETDMIQLSGKSLEDSRIVGIYEIKRRMQELDERIAEAGRRYREYENAYE